MDSQKIKEIYGKRLGLLKTSALKRIVLRPQYFLPRIFRAQINKLLKTNIPKHFVAQTFWGDRMEVVLPDDIAYWGFPTGEEIEFTKFLLANVSAGHTFIDIGAHNGFYSLLGSALVGPKGRVISFEPTPTTFQLLQKNTKGKPNIITNQNAIWDNNEKISFTDFGESHAMYNSFLSETTNPTANVSKDKKQIFVSAIKLDDYLSQIKIKPDIIKLDVEGAELHALLGMEQTLKLTRPIISVEFWTNENWSNNNDEIIKFMTNLGYTIYKTENGQLLRYTGEKEFPSGYTNLVFKHTNSQ